MHGQVDFYTHVTVGLFVMYICCTKQAYDDRGDEPPKPPFLETCGGVT